MIDARWIQDSLRRRRMGALQRECIWRFAELEEGSGKTRLLEHPIAATRLLVILALPHEPFRKLRPIRRRDQCALDREAARHGQSTISGKLSSVCLSDARNLSASEPSTMR